MDFIKIATVGTLVAMTPAIAAAGGLNADFAVEEVVVAPEEDDDEMVMGSLGSGALIGGLVIVALALALSGDDDDDSTSGTNEPVAQ